ncbi:MAG: hypothetical protein ACREA2_17390 [Blastocatellia bacterium]
MFIQWQGRQGRAIPQFLLLTLAVSLLFTIELRAHPGWGIVVDGSGQVYFADADRNKIWRIDQQGRLEAIITGRHSHEITIDQSGSLYGTHLYYEPTGARWFTSFWRMAPNSVPIDLVPATDDPPRGIGLLRDAQGAIYSGDYSENKVRVIKMSPDGQITVIAGGEKGHADGQGPQAKFNLIQTMVWGGDGALYVLDKACVRRVTPDGIVTTVGANPLAGIERGGQRQWLLGLSADARGNVYVADNHAACLWRIKSDNIAEAVTTGGWFWSPTGIAAAGGDLYVLEHLRESVFAAPAALGVGPYIRVRKLTPDGTVTTIATVWGQMTLPVAAVLLAMTALVAFWMRRRRRRAKSGGA